MISESSETPRPVSSSQLALDQIYLGDSKNMLDFIPDNSISLSIWSPPYHVGKKYESGQSYEDWCSLLKTVIMKHYRILKPGAFLVINIDDILVFKDETMPKIQANNVSSRRCSVTEEDVRRAVAEHPDYNRYQLADLLGCSEQTVQRRLQGNNSRGGKYNTQTRVKLVGGLLEEYSIEAGLFPYDRRIWLKDPAWANCNWTSNSYRAVDEFEHLFFFWKPGVTTVNRDRLTKEEWTEWGSRGVWYIPSVRKNDDHEAKFPIELPRRAIKLLTDPGDTVLDCFMGSGSSAVAATIEGRHYIGIDSDEAAVKLARKNVASIITGY